MNTFRSLFVLMIVLLGCGGGGGGDNSGPSQNACSLLRTTTRIIDGTQCSTSDSPVVALRLQGGASSALCSGTVISERAILTAAHCFLVVNPRSVTIIANGRNITASGSFVHPGASVDQAAGVVNNDAAIVISPVDLDIAPVPLITSRDPSNGGIVSIFGYGYDEDRNLGALRSGQMRISNVTSSHFFAEFDRGTGSNTCQGDSGGPALDSVETDAGEVVGILGITSTGKIENCGDGDLSGFVRIDAPSVLNFILQHVPDASTL